MEEARKLKHRVAVVKKDTKKKGMGGEGRGGLENISTGSFLLSFTISNCFRNSDIRLGTTL